DTVGQAGRPAAGRRGTGDHRSGQAPRWPAGRGGHRRAAGAHGRAAVPGAGAAQGRRHEARSGAVGLRGGAARGPGRSVPGRSDQAAGGRATAARGDGARRAGAGAGPPLARAVRALRRPAGRRGQHRPGAQGRVGRRPGGGRQDPVPRCRAGAAVRPPAAQPGGPPVLRLHPRARRQAAHRGARGAGDRGARLPAGGGGAGDLRRGVRRRPGDPRPRRRDRDRAGPRDGVDGGRPAVAHHPRGHPGGAGPSLAAARPVPAVRPRARGSAPRRPAPRQLPPAARRAAGRHRLRCRQPPPRRLPRADRPAGAARPRRQGRRGPGRPACGGLRQGVDRRGRRRGAPLPAAPAGAGRPADVPLQPGVAARAGHPHRRPPVAGGAARPPAQPAAVVPAHPPRHDGDHRRAVPAQRPGGLPLRARALAARLRHLRL
ncbi:MAG: Uncharacterized ABC1 family protein SCO5192, partial [uncultured Frankineae bacterium]